MDNTYKIVTYGMAAVNKPRGTKKLRVWLYHLLPGLQDELTEAVKEIRRQGLDNEGEIFSSIVKKGATVEAEWFGQTNRVTPPDIRRGEQLEIFQIPGVDKYYWHCPGRDDDLRRLETVVYAFNANPDNTDAELNPENCYYLEISTHDKHVTFRTSDKNNEKAKYVFQFNLAEGTVTLEDDNGNSFHLDSLAKLLLLVNGDETHVRLDKKLLSLFAKDNITALTKTISLTAETMTVKADTLGVTAATTFEGGVSIDTLNVSGNSSMGTVEADGVSAGTIHGDSYSGGHH